MNIALVFAGLEKKKLPDLEKAVTKLWSPPRFCSLEYVYGGHIGDGANAQQHMTVTCDRALRRSDLAHLFVLVRQFRYFKKSQLKEIPVTYIPNGALHAVASAVSEFLKTVFSR
jgi:hypothetical protein